MPVVNVTERRCTCRRMILPSGTISTELGGVVHTDDGYCHYFDEADEVVVLVGPETELPVIPENPGKIVCKCGDPVGSNPDCAYKPCYSVTVKSKDSKMEFATYVRKPFVVQAIEVTRENIAEVAKHVGDLREKEDGTPFILVDRRLVPNVYRVYPGFWMTKMGENVRCYSRKIFTEQFTNHTAEIQDWVDFLNSPKSADREPVA